MLISQLYNPKGITIKNTATISQALSVLIKKRINGLVVLNDKEEIVGVLALQDVAGATVPRQFRRNIHMAAAMYRPGFFSDSCQEIKNQKVTTIMRRNFVVVNLSDNIMAVTADFLKNDLYIVPVVDKGKFVGIVTRSEIKKALAYGMRLQGYDKNLARAARR